MSTKTAVIQSITSQGLLPLFYHEDAQLSLDIIRTLYRAGVRVLEYTNRGDAAIENFRFIKSALKNEMQDLFFGIGTVKNTNEASSFLKAGADFVVCPVVDPEVGKMVHEAGLLWIPGCFSPTEINIAHQHGAGIIKLFPANVLGPEFLSAIKTLFGNQLFVPTGGVEIEEGNIGNWFKTGVCAVGLGSKLISKEILANKDHEQLFSLTTEALRIINKVKP